MRNAYHADDAGVAERGLNNKRTILYRVAAGQ